MGCWPALFYPWPRPGKIEEYHPAGAPEILTDLGLLCLGGVNGALSFLFVQPRWLVIALTMKISDLFHLVPTESQVMASGREQQQVKPVQAAVQIGDLALQLEQFVQGKVLHGPEKGLVELLVAGEKVQIPGAGALEKGQEVWLQARLVDGAPQLRIAGQQGAIPILLKKLAGILPQLPEFSRELAVMPQADPLFAALGPAIDPGLAPGARPGVGGEELSGPLRQENLEPTLRLLATMAGLGGADSAPQLATRLISLVPQDGGGDALHKLFAFFMSTPSSSPTGVTATEMLSRLATQLPTVPLAQQVLGDEPTFFTSPASNSGEISGSTIGPVPLPSTITVESVQTLARVVGLPLAADLALPAAHAQLVDFFAASLAPEMVNRLLLFVAAQPVSLTSPSPALLLSLANYLPQPETLPATTSPSLAAPLPPLAREMIPLLTLAATGMDATPRPNIVRLLSMLGGAKSLPDITTTLASKGAGDSQEISPTLQKLVNLLEIHGVVNRQPPMAGHPQLLILPCFFANQAGWGEWFWRHQDSSSAEQEEQHQNQEELFFFLEMTILGPITIKIILVERRLVGTISVSMEDNAAFINTLLPAFSRRLEALGWHSQLHCQVKSIKAMHELQHALLADSQAGSGAGLVDVQA